MSDDPARPPSSSPLLAAFRLGAACGAVVGLIEAVRAMATMPHPGWDLALVLSVDSALGYGLLAGVAAMLAVALWRGRRGGRNPPGEAALASGAAVGVLVAVLRGRWIVGLARPELAHLLVGSLLEGVACGAGVALLADRISRRRLLRAWGIVASTALVGGATLVAVRRAGAHPSASGGESATAPNVLLISLDTTRADRLGAYGRAPSFTPNLDRLATQGILFETAHSPAPLTGPSHTSMLTGRFPAHHGALVNGAHLRDEVDTLPEALSRRGFRTAAFVSGWTLTDRSSGLASRFREYDDNLSPNPLLPDAAKRVPLLWLADRTGQFLAQHGRSLTSAGPFRGRPEERPGRVTIDLAERWLDQHRDERFFLFVHLFDPHEPYAPPAKHREAVDPGYHGDLLYFDALVHRRPGSRLGTRPDDLERVRRLYEAEIAEADEQVGRLLTKLHELGLDRRTLVVLTADHGEGLGEHGEYFVHDMLYESTLHVPLIFRLPDGSGAGLRIATAVRLIDLAPTILEFTGGELAPGVDGVSLGRLLRGSADSTPRVAFASNTKERQLGRSLYSVSSGGFKLIWRLGDGWLLARTPAAEELFDLAADPRELDNLVVRPDPPAALASLRELLRSWVERGADAPSPALDDEAREKLRSLGYL